MKNAKMFLFSLIAWCLLFAGPAMGLLVAHGVPCIVAFMSLLVVTLLVSALSRGQAVNAYRAETVNQVFWSNLITERLFKLNQFLKYARNHDQYVVGGSAVVIPQPGAAPTVIKNNASWPLVAVQRTDSVIMYLLNTYITQPTAITEADLLDISYDKSQSVLKDHFGYLIQAAADDQIVNYCNGLPASCIKYTTGPSTADLLPGQVGMRNTFRWQDAKAWQLGFDLQNIPKAGRYALLSSNHMHQFTSSLGETEYRDFSKYYDPKEGKIGRMFGFDFLDDRSTAVQAAAALNNGALSANALGQAMGPTDNEGSFFWHEDSIARAMGPIKLFTRVDDPYWTGTVNNCFIKLGGNVYRSDYAGVGVTMQGIQAGN